MKKQILGNLDRRDIRNYLVLFVCERKLKTNEEQEYFSCKHYCLAILLYVIRLTILRQQPVFENLFFSNKIM